MKEANQVINLQTFTTTVEKWIEEVEGFIANPDSFYPLPESTEVDRGTTTYTINERREIRTRSGGNHQMGFFRERMIIHRQVISNYHWQE